VLAFEHNLLADVGEPSAAGRVLGRWSGPTAPSQLAAFSDGRVAAVYEEWPNNKVDHTT